MGIKRNDLATLMSQSTTIESEVKNEEERQANTQQFPEQLPEQKQSRARGRNMDGMATYCLRLPASLLAETNEFARRNHTTTKDVIIQALQKVLHGKVDAKTLF